MPLVLGTNDAANDRVDDEAGRIIHAARVADFRLFLDVGMPVFDRDDIAEKPLVDDAENVVADDGEIPRSIRGIKRADEVGQDVVGYGQRFREVILEQVAIVFAIQLAELGRERLIKVASFRADAIECVFEFAVATNAAVLAHAHEHEAVNETLDGLGEAGGAMLGVRLGEVFLIVVIDRAREVLAILLQIIEEHLIDRFVAAEVDQHAIDGAQAAAARHFANFGAESFE